MNPGLDLKVNLQLLLRVGADKSLPRPTSRCRRTESIVSMERGACSCAEFQVFSCYRGRKKACQATRTISTTSRRELSSSFFPARQGAEGNSRHSDRNIRGTCTIVCHRQKLGNLEFIHPRCAIENLCKERLYRHRCWSGRLC